MTTHDFVLTVTLPRPDDDPEQYVDALYEAGCDDATLGIGRRGLMGLHFMREAICRSEAVASATAAVLCAIPGAHVVNVE